MERIAGFYKEAGAAAGGFHFMPMLNSRPIK
jgi:hypothetical protein